MEEDIELRFNVRGKSIKNYELLSVILNYELCILNYELSQRFHFFLGKAGCLRYLFPRKPKLQDTFLPYDAVDAPSIFKRQVLYSHK